MSETKKKRTKRKKKKKSKKGRKKRVKPRDPFFLKARLHSGSGSHGDDMKEQERKKCRGKVEVDDS